MTLSNSDALEVLIEMKHQKDLPVAYEAALDVGIDATNKQVGVIPDEDPYNTRYYCPLCHTWVTHHQRYCDNCGHALDWSYYKNDNR